MSVSPLPQGSPNSDRDDSTYDLKSNELSCLFRDIESLHNEITQKKTQIKHLQQEIQGLIPSQKHNSDNNLDLADKAISDEITSIYTKLLAWTKGLLPSAYNSPLWWSRISEYLVHNKTGGFSEFPLSGGAVTSLVIELLVSSFSHVLWEIIFTPTLVGIPSEECAFLADLRHRMSLTMSGEDTASLKQYLSFLFRAFTATDQYESRLDFELLRVWSQIGNILDLVRHKGSFDTYDRLHQFEKDISKPITKLVVKIRCSGENFRWIWFSSDSRDFRKHMLDHFDCIDSRTHLLVAIDKLNYLADDIIIGSVIQPIFPGLCRDTANSEPGTIIKKGYVLVELREDIVQFVDLR